MPQSALVDLSNAMSGGPSTNGWDVVTSYSIDQLNTFLSQHYNAGKLAKQLTFQVDKTNPVDRKPFKITYVLNLLSPQLSFVSGVSGQATLRMPIGPGSSYQVTPEGQSQLDSPTEIPTTYSIILQAPLAAISGDGTVIQQGGVVTFSEQGSSGQVVIHFQNEKGAKFSIEPTPDTSNTDILGTYFLPALQQYFQSQIREIDYALAAVNNETPATGVSLLTPKSFAFASYGDPSDDHTGALSLYIQTTQSGSPPGSPIPSFQAGGIPCSPVPAGYTASVIFSNEMIRKTFLKAQLEADPNNFAVTIVSPPSGICIQAQLAKEISVSVPDEHQFTGSGSFDANSFDISFTNSPIILTIQNGKASISWSGSTTTKWEQSSSGQAGTMKMDGTVKIDAQLSPKSVTIGVENNVISIPTLTVEASDITVTPHNLSGAYLPAFYNNLRIQLPAISLTLPGIDYFLETNLLAPGQAMITINSGAGVSTPRDFLIVGTVN